MMSHYHCFICVASLRRRKRERGRQTKKKKCNKFAQYENCGDISLRNSVATKRILFYNAVYFDLIHTEALI